MIEPPPDAPWGYDLYTHTEVIPKPPPTTPHWQVGPVTSKRSQPEPGPPGSPATGHEEFTMQLTADQQVALTITGEDRDDNPVDISGDIAWLSSDESVVTVEQTGENTAVATAVGPAGTAAVTVTNDVDQDGSGDFQGSIAIDVVAGDIAEIVVSAGEPTDKG